MRKTISIPYRRLAPAIALIVPLALVAYQGALARPLPETPILRIEAGAHGSDVTGLAADAGGKLLATSSYDKTLRLWRLADPSAPVRVIRPPIDFDREGSLYTVALSPDGSRAVTAGWTGSGGDSGSWSLYVFDTASGEMVKRVATLTGRLLSLAFSADGKRLAAGLKDKPAVILFDTENWSVVSRDDEQRDDMPSIDMDKQGRVVAASLGGTISLYEAGLRNKRTIDSPGGKEPAIVRFSPDGATIAVGYSDSPRVDLLAADDLHLIASADTRGIDKGFIVLAWSRSGNYLYGSGYYERGGRNPIRRWENGGRGAGRDFSITNTVVTRLQPLPDDSLAFTTQGGTFGLLDPMMRLVWEKKHGAADFRDQHDTLKVSADGGTVEFSFERFGAAPVRFSLATKALSPGEPPDPKLAGALTEAPGLKVIDWNDTERPALNGMTLPLKTHESSLSLAIAPDQKSFVLGTAWRVLKYDAGGKLAWEADAPGEAWAAVVTGNGKFAVVAFNDGTIRWLRMSDGQTLLSLFTHAESRRWVAWTASGYYVASAGGDGLIGWHVNRGADKTADFFSIARFRDIYYRPDVVEKILGTLDEGQAIKRGDAETGRTTKSTDLAALLPPIVTINSPAEGAAVAASKVSFAYDIRRLSREPIKSVQLRADGRPIAVVEAGATPIAEQGTIEAYIPRRDATIEMIAETASGIWSEPAALKLHWTGPAEEIKPSLFILAVGISQYRAPELKLALADKDASDFKNVFDQQQKAYRKVEIVTLENEKATAAEIRRALEWFASAPTSHDVAMLFMAGHGVDDQGGRYFFVPQEVGPKEALSQGLSYQDIRRALASVAGRVLFFIDTCHSGAAWGDPGKSATDVSRIVNDLNSPEHRIMTFASSTGRQRSYEKAEWGNGAFTKAVVEGLKGEADFFKNGYVTTAELDAYVSDRVSKLTLGQQTPAIGRPFGVDYPLVQLR
jgi:WD40 repeat protein